MYRLNIKRLDTGHKLGYSGVMYATAEEARLASDDLEHYANVIATIEECADPFDIDAIDKSE